MKIPQILIFTSVFLLSSCFVVCDDWDDSDYYTPPLLSVISGEEWEIESVVDETGISLFPGYYHYRLLLTQEDGEAAHYDFVNMNNADSLLMPEGKKQGLWRLGENDSSMYFGDKQVFFSERPRSYMRFTVNFTNKSYRFTLRR